MTKADIVNEIANKTGADKAIVQDTVEEFFEVVKRSMAKGNNLYFRGFGTFMLKKRAKKVARNITRNTSIIVDEHFIPKFKPSKEFTSLIKDSAEVQKLL